MRWQRLAGVVALVALLIFGGIGLRDILGFDLSPDSIREWVVALGWLAPIVYVLLLAFRQFLALPSSVILPAGGALFGVVGGTLLGGLGVLASGALCFALGRALRHARRDPSRVEPLNAASSGIGNRTRLGAARAAGPVLIGLITAHPTGPMTAVHSAAGMSPLPWVTFLLAVGSGATVRAFVLSFFGASLLDVGSRRFWLATLLMLAVATLPFLYAPLRQWMFRRVDPEGNPVLRVPTSAESGEVAPRD